MEKYGVPDTVGKNGFRTSCGVIVSDGPRLLLGHAGRSHRWDIPKGIAEIGEEFPDAAVRELFEETGLSVELENLRSLGVHDYLPRKRLALYFWRLDPLPNPAGLTCRSFVTAGATSFPELDRFAIVPWSKAVNLVGANLARVLRVVQPQIDQDA